MSGWRADLSRGGRGRGGGGAGGRRTAVERRPYHAARRDASPYRVDRRAISTSADVKRRILFWHPAFPWAWGQAPGSVTGSLRSGADAAKEVMILVHAMRQGNG